MRSTRYQPIDLTRLVDDDSNKDRYTPDAIRRRRSLPDCDAPGHTRRRQPRRNEAQRDFHVLAVKEEFEEDF